MVMTVSLLYQSTTLSKIVSRTHFHHVPLAYCNHDPVVQVLPDDANFAESRVAQRCQVDLDQGMRTGTRFGAEATRPFREERLHSWLTPERLPPRLPLFLLRCASLSSP